MTEGEPSLTSIIVEGKDDKLADLAKGLLQKTRNPALHLKTPEAWLRRAQTTRVASLEHAVTQFCRPCESADANPAVVAAESAIVVESTPREKVQAVDMLPREEAPQAGASIAVLPTRDAFEKSSAPPDSEMAIEAWYKGSVRALDRSQSDERYRRKRAALRVEYWTRMDRLRNNSAPTVING